ncbi:MAG: flippase-like domain-containing protein [Deltaproteobacteria bacterium]|nr:flippase-like domain-containing protein [Deltaproteobacteria bacterium]MCB9786741.1 flippase-like domain-containing protein [Deltaproteobacteria bacterium]
MSGLGRRVLVGLLAGLAVIIALMVWSDARKLADALSTFELPLLAPVLALSLTGYAFRALKWQAYLARLDIRVERTRSILCFLSGMVMSITPGKVGEVLKSFLLRESDGVPIARTAPIVIAERTTDLIALLIMATWGAASLAYGGAVIIAGALLVAALIILLSWPSAGALAVRAVASVRFTAAIAPRLDEARVSMNRLMGLRLLLGTSALSLAAWGAEAVGTWLVLRAFPGTHASLGDATFVYAFATLAGALSMLPGGVLATEGSMILLLTSVLAVVPSEQVATAATLLVRFTTLWLGVLLGAGALWLFRRRYLGDGEGRGPRVDPGLPPDDLFGSNY